MVDRFACLLDRSGRGKAIIELNIISKDRSTESLV